MNIEQFWQLIDQSRADAEASGDPYEQSQALTAALAELEPEDILDFDALARELMDRAYTADLWEAFSVIEPGCSDDGFYAWRQWLIGQGRTAYERAVAQPDTLADLVEVDQESFEVLLGVADEAYAQVTGSPLPYVLRDEAPLMEKLHEDDEIFERFPRLAAKFVADEE